MARKPKVSLSLTPAAIAVLDHLVQRMDSSRSALVEQILQGQVVLHTPLGEWTVRWEATEDGATVTAVVPGGEETPEAEPKGIEAAASEPLATGETTDLSDEVQTLRQQIADLEAQLAIANAEPAPTQIETQGTVPETSAELTTLNQQVADLQAQLARAEAVPPVPAQPQGMGSDVTLALQRQLMDAIAAQSNLKAQLHTQAQELARLRQTLAQQQSLAAIGERQLNRWQHQTYAR